MDLKNKGLLFVLSAPSGCGKDTIIKELKKCDINMKQSISDTTRDVRKDEVDGVDYCFIDVEAFEKRIENNYYIEYVKYGTNYYGTPKEKVEKLIEDGTNVLLKIEVEGAGNIRKIYPDAITVFVVPPSMEVLEERLRNRETETEESIQSRLAIARDELSRADEYDYIVVNDVVSDCVDRVCAIISAEQSRYSYMKSFVDNMK